MTLRNYYRAALALPLVVPLLLLPAARVAGRTSLVGELASLLLYSLLLGGVPYLGFLAWELRRMIGRTDAEQVRAVWTAPLRFGYWLGACWAAVMVGVLALEGEFALTGGLAFGVFMTMMGVGFGYAYVSVAELGRGLLAHRGLLDAPDED